jgi:hypothetical protein
LARDRRRFIVSGATRNARDLLGGQAAERAQRQRHLGFGRERRVAAGEDELQPLVGDRGLVVHLVLHGLRDLEQAGLGGQGALAAQSVDRGVAGGPRQPGAGVLRRAVARPACRRDRERLLRGVLGEVEVAEEADE